MKQGKRDKELTDTTLQLIPHAELTRKALS